ncbi:X2-like carbohydrate binding domain-containing protein [Paenibacillus daejeonensis]|uniref:X2-like carbohydrate binding domain-containing protein n=1 Tax=Paenibacillus daejeonensis TaxID=135193 RepID=UPI00035D614B|nr:X2-like carbohydrate binding domain-containing protein [Paenibacillus daejeonensis]
MPTRIYTQLILRTLVLALLTSLFVVSHPQTGWSNSTNLLANPGFESWNGTSPTGWTLLKVGSATVERLTLAADVADGDSSVSLRAPLAGDRSDLRVDGIPVTGGEPYEVSFVYRKPANTSTSIHNFRLTYRTSQGTAITPTHVVQLPATAASNYTPYSAIVNAPANAASVTYEWDIRNGGRLDLDLARFAPYVEPPPVLTFDKKPALQADLTLSIDLTGRVVTGLSDGLSTLTKGSDYWILGGEIVISRAFLAAQLTGPLTLTITFSTGPEEEVDVVITDSSLPDRGPNLLTNANLDSWSGTSLPGWTFNTGGSGSITRANTAGYRHSGSAVRLDAPGAGDHAALTQAALPVEPYSTYRASFKYRTSFVSGEARLQVLFKSADGLTLSNPYTTLMTEEHDRFATSAELDVTAPPGAVSATVVAEVEYGLVWVDTVVFQDIANQVVNGSFERPVPNNGWDTVTSPASSGATTEWLAAGGHDLGGAMQVTTSGTAEEVILNQSPIPLVDGIRRFKINVLYQIVDTDSTHQSRVRLTWLDATGMPLGAWAPFEAEAFDSSGEWRRLTQVLLKPEDAAQLRLELISGGGVGETRWDGITIEPWLDLYKADGTLASDIEMAYDWSNEIPPDVYWSLIPEATTTPAQGSVWTSELVRRHFFGLDGYYYLNAYSPINNKLALGQLSTLPVTVGVAAGPNDPSSVFAGDLPYNPIVSPTGPGNEYYQGGNQSAAGNHAVMNRLTGDPSFRDRSDDMVNFSFYTQYTPDGDNDFVRNHYPDEWQTLLDTGRNVAYRGGWDYKFNWNWTNVYGYTYPKHSPDGHVNAQIGARLIHAYHVNGDPELLDAVYDYAYYQFPRTGFNKGSYRGRTYYYTGYGPSTTGIPDDASNPLGDASDNVNAAKAHLLAQLGYLKQDAKMLELARGLLWYLVREYEYDRAFFYDAAENPLNTTRAVLDQSHEIMLVWDAMHAFAYLKEAGVEIGPEEDVWLDAYDMTAETGLWYQGSRHLKALKAYDGTLAPDETLTVVTYVQVNGEGQYADVVWFDELGTETVRPASLDVRVSRVVPPTSGEPDWTVDPSRDAVLTVMPELLETEGMVLPWSLAKGEMYRIAYDVTLTPDFDRLTDTMPNSGLAIPAAGGTEMVGGMAPPLSIDLNVDASSMLSYPAQLYFPFASAIGAELELGVAPASSTYVPPVAVSPADSYRFHFKDLAPVSVTGPFTNGIYGHTTFKGSIAYSIFVPDTAPASADYSVTLERLIGDSAYQASIDNAPLAAETLVSSTLRTSTHDLGTVTLTPGWHTLRFDTPGSMGVLNLTLTAQ